MMSMKMLASIALILLLAASILPERANAQANNQSNPASSPSAADSDSTSWLFPIEKLDEALPSWLHIGGEYRDRFEGPIGIGYQRTNDFYLLDRLRVNVAIQPTDWLKFYGEVQDSRIFFNHHIANANPFEDSWTLWQGYIQVGSSTSGWADALAGRQVLLFGDERVIGPSNWVNVGRTFDVARVDLHHPGYEVAIFGSSVVPGSNTFLHRAIPGRRVLCPRSSTTTPSLMGRRVLLAHLPSAHGRAMPAWARRFPTLPQRRGSLSRATTPRERKIRPDETGIPLTSSILLITTSSVLPI